MGIYGIFSVYLRFPDMHAFFLANNQQQLFDEIPVRLVLLAPYKGGNVRTKEREGNLSNAGCHPS